MTNLADLHRRQAHQRKALQQKHARNDICPECGGRGHHWVQPGPDGFGGRAFGFWTCPKFYGPDGRRISL